MADVKTISGSISKTQAKTEAGEAEGVLFFDEYLTIAEAKLKFSISEAEAKSVENKIKYWIRNGKIRSIKGNKQTDPIKVPASELESLLSETKVNTQVKSDQLELVNSLRETIALLKSQTEALTEIVHSQSEQIRNLTEVLKQSQGNLYLEKQEKQFLLEQKNQPKKGWRNWFGGGSQ